MPNLIDIAKPFITVPLKAAGQADQLVRKLRGGDGGREPDDATLEHEVEAAVYALPGVSRAKVEVTVADGAVTLHGEARNQAQVAAIQTAARRVPQVTVVESELRLTKKPAARAKAAAKGRTERIDRDTTTPLAPTPKEIAATGQGRPPAPMGSTEDAS